MNNFAFLVCRCGQTRLRPLVVLSFLWKAASAWPAHWGRLKEVSQHAKTMESNTLNWNVKGYKKLNHKKAAKSSYDLYTLSSISMM